MATKLPHESSSRPTMPPTKPVPRQPACDECYRRKVRCNRRQPCQACLESMHPCTRNIKRKRKGPPKGSGSINAELRKRIEYVTAYGTEALDSRIEVPSQGQYFTDGDFSYKNKASTIERDIFTPSVEHEPATPSVAASADINPLFPPSPTSNLGTEQSQTSSRKVPLHQYDKYLELFHQRLHPIWPVISYQELWSALHYNDHDLESHGLAAALCAAAIAQLRLPEHTTSEPGVTTSHHFEADVQRLRGLSDYRERPTLSTLLTSFFLHIYFANTEKIMTAGYYLREAIGFSYVIRLHQPKTATSYSLEEQRIRLRVYWILFVSERTFCIQNNCPITLQEIEQLPDSLPTDDSNDSELLPSFVTLTRLFTFVGGPLGQQSLENTPSSNPTSEVYKKDKVSNLQTSLGRASVELNIGEVQRADFHATRNWIRTLLWKYTLSHFRISRHATDQAFSALLPMDIAKDSLIQLTSMSPDSIQAHGYGMELKIFQIMDSLLDVMLCIPTEQNFSSQPQSMNFGSRDVLHSLEQLLITVGGPNSSFLRFLHQRMAELKQSIPRGFVEWIPDEDGGGDVEDQEAGLMAVARMELLQ